MTTSALAGQAVLVTGASSGIGAAIAVALAEHGARVAITARRRSLLEDVAARCRDLGAADVALWTADLSDVDAASAVADAAWNHFDGLDGVVNNAGIPKRRLVSKLTYDEVVETMTVNYLAPVRIMLTVLPRMIDRGTGTIVNIGSGAARAGSPQESAYSGSKFALAGFSEAAFVDLAGTGVRLRMVEPGPIDTPIWDDVPGNDKPIYQGRFYPPSDVAAAVLDALVSDRFEYFVPPEQHGIIAFKSRDIDSFLAGAIAFAQGKLDPSDVS